MDMQTIVVPSDFSAHSERALAWGLAIAEKWGACLLLVHVIENPLAEMYHPDQVEIDPRRMMEESRKHPPRWAQPFWEHAHRVAEEKLTLLPQSFAGDRPRVKRLTQEGNAVEEILRLAREEKADLIVMGSHGRTGLLHVLLGSVAERVVRHAPCPVLVVRHPRPSTK